MSQNTQKIGESRETWCAVERLSTEDWDRTERSHHADILKSTVFDQEQIVYEGRDSWVKGSLIPHRPRKHFSLAHKSHNIL